MITEKREGLKGKGKTVEPKNEKQPQNFNCLNHRNIWVPSFRIELAPGWSVWPRVLSKRTGSFPSSPSQFLTVSVSWWNASKQWPVTVTCGKALFKHTKVTYWGNRTLEKGGFNKEFFLYWTHLFRFIFHRLWWQLGNDCSRPLY